MSRIRRLRRPRRREHKQTKHGACSCAKDLYKKEMEKMSTTNNPYQKAEQQSAVISASSQPQQIGAIQGNLTVASNSLPLLFKNQGTVTGGPFGAQISGTGLTNPTLRSEALESDAFKMPVALLVDLWITKYGNDWVDIVDLQDDTFWNIVYVRLKALGEVEVHYLTDRARYVCRKPI